MLEVRPCAELGIDLAIIDDRVVTAQRTLAGYFAYRLARHDPDDVDAVLLQRRQQRLCSGKSALFGRLAGV